MPIEITWRPVTPTSDVRAGHVKLSGSGPFQIGRSHASDVQLDHAQVSRTHAEIAIDGGTVTITDAASQNGTIINGQRIRTTRWAPGAEATLGPFVLTYRWIEARALAGNQPPLSEPVRPVAQGPAFPGKLFDQRQVPIRDIMVTGKVSHEVNFAAIGGGLGSFMWVDHLRVFGVQANDIRVLGIAGDRRPYSKWGRLCRNSQIPEHERIRSNSISTADNIWGFPGYASREMVRDLLQGRLVGIKHILQVFGEPNVTESFTPRLSDIFKSVDKEAQRIGWEDMWVSARVLAVRKTDDERYVIAYRASSESEADTPSAERDRFVIARFIQVSTGYPAANFLEDLQKFRYEHPGATNVVNAYEEHDEIYRTLERQGGTVLIRGRGIVASRVIQRVAEARSRNPNIRILHLMRSPVTEGHKYDFAKRPARNDVEHQPFNWPKACWGGSLRQKLERASPEERSKLMAAWGGTTTADRDDWNVLIETGKAEGWYKVFYGSVGSITDQGGRIVTRLQSTERFQESLELAAEFVIDCTGLIAKIDETPLIADIVKTYDVARNKVTGDGPEARLSGIAVSNNFDIPGLQNGRGRAFAAGIITANGPYAAVDSFLGLQYAALRAVDHLATLRAPGVSRFGPFRSSYQWIKWCAGASP